MYLGTLFKSLTNRCVSLTSWSCGLIPYQLQNIFLRFRNFSSNPPRLGKPTRAVFRVSCLRTVTKNISFPIFEVLETSPVCISVSFCLKIVTRKLFTIKAFFRVSRLRTVTKSNISKFLMSEHLRVKWTDAAKTSQCCHWSCEEWRKVQWRCFLPAVTKTTIWTSALRNWKEFPLTFFCRFWSAWTVFNCTYYWLVQWSISIFFFSLSWTHNFGLWSLAISAIFHIIYNNRTVNLLNFCWKLFPTEQVPIYCHFSLHEKDWIWALEDIYGSH